MKEKIAVGMSGGVDSSVTALLLKNQGYEVIGITMILKPCLTQEDTDNLYKEANDAKAVCDKIGIEHFVPNFTKEFAKNVTEQFVSQYFDGKTPNPCVRCNSTMKFGAMLDFALSLGCTKIATGHYAITEKVGDRVLLKKSESPKDQSYFLYTLTQHQLKHTVFPLISMEKSEARAIAQQYDLPVAQKPDSQDICFVKDGDYVSFIENYSGKKAPKGNFVDQDGKILGEHGGIYKYTVGQRKGLGISLGYKCFVSKIDSENNTVTLTEHDKENRTTLIANSCNFIQFDILEKPMQVMAKTRYRAKPQNAQISPLENGKVLVEFEQVQKFLCPGQSVVFYKDDIVVGGGVIEI